MICSDRALLDYKAIMHCHSHSSNQRLSSLLDLVFCTSMVQILFKDVVLIPWVKCRFCIDEMICKCWGGWMKAQGATCRLVFLCTPSHCMGLLNIWFSVICTWASPLHKSTFIFCYQRSKVWMKLLEQKELTLFAILWFISSNSAKLLNSWTN